MGIASVADVATATGVSAADIAAANGIGAGDAVSAGQRLTVSADLARANPHIAGAAPLAAGTALTIPVH